MITLSSPPGPLMKERPAELSRRSAHGGRQCYEFISVYAGPCSFARDRPAGKVKPGRIKVRMPNSSHMYVGSTTCDSLYMRFMDSI